MHAIDVYLSLCGAGAPYWNQGWSEQEGQALRIRELIVRQAEAFVRSCFPAHVTGSAFVVDETLGATLLVHHRKLGKWMQPGGHSDGDRETHRVAMREAQEETGVTTLSFLPLPGVSAGGAVPVPFDVDIHPIPAHRSEPEHEHFDMRYLLVAPSAAQPVVSDESFAVAWVPWARLADYTREDSVLRMAEKVRRIRALLEASC